MQTQGIRLPWLVAVLIFVSGALVIAISATGSANHLTNCRQYDGDDGPNNIITPDDVQCDEVWAYGGTDFVNTHDGADYLAMGAGTDEGHGGSGGDEIYGGDNPTTAVEKLYEGDGGGGISDQTGPDTDLACGGTSIDRLLVNDSDPYDTAKGEAPTNVSLSNDDQVTGDGGDILYRDGTC